MAGRYATNSDNDLLNQIRDLERRIRDLESGNRIGFTSLDSGEFVVSIDGQLVFRIGKNGFEGDVPGFAFFRPNGTAALTLNDFAGTDQFVGIYDRGGNLVLADDREGGIGLGRPYLNLDFHNTDDFYTPPFSSTSATFTAKQTIIGLIQNPKIQVVVLTQADASTTGEIRLSDPTSGTVISGPLTISANSLDYKFLEGSVVHINYLNSIFKYDVELRRASGAGTVRMGIMYAIGRET